jgi:PAS domain S-box-containing protein
VSNDIEAERIKALKRLSILDTPPEVRFDHLTELAAFTFRVPIALISLIDEERQWFKSTVGLTETETERTIAFCDCAIRSDDVLVVPNALKDDRFKDNPFVTGEPGIRFYAGAPLKTPDGHRIGTLCVLDVKPRAAPTEAMQGRLKAMAASVMDAMLVRGAWASSPLAAPTGGHKADQDGLKRLQWAFNAYTRAASTLLHSGTVDDVANSVCEALVDEDTYAAAFVGLADGGPNKAVRVVARAGRASDYVDKLNLSWADNELAGQGPAGRAMRSGLPELVSDTLESPVFTQWRGLADEFGIRSSVIIPFKRGEDIFGILAVYSSDSHSFGSEEMEIFQQLGEELAFSMTLERERKQFESAKASVAAAEESVAQFEKREAFYHLIMDQIDDIILSYDLEGNIDFVSSAIKNIGYTPAEVIGRNLKDFTPPDVADGLALRAIRNGDPIPRGRENVTRFCPRGGPKLWMESRPSKRFTETANSAASLPSSAM